MIEQRYEEFEVADYDMRGKFQKECDECGKTHTLFTQHDHDPEYYTTVTAACDCGAHVSFSLPVN